MKRTMMLALACSVIACAANAVLAAKEPQFALTLTTKKTKVKLGETITFHVTLRETSGKQTQVGELRLARNSVSLQVKIGDVTHVVTRIYGTLSRTSVIDDTPDQHDISQGKPLSVDIPFLAIRSGDLSVSALYAGLSGTRLLTSKPVVVHVTAPKGKSQIAAVMKTSDGTMVFTFFTDKAFNTVLNFLTLAKQGFYDKLTFHRIIKGFMIQGGDPNGDGTGGPGWYIPAEFNPDLHHVKGILSMARAQPKNSGGSQFFVMDGTTPQLDGKYAAFGKLVEGEDVLDKLANTKVRRSDSGEPSEPIHPPVIESVEVTTR